MLPFHELLGWLLVAFSILYSARGWSHRVAFALVALVGVIVLLWDHPVAVVVTYALTGCNLGASVCHVVGTTPAQNDNEGGPGAP